MVRRSRIGLIIGLVWAIGMWVTPSSAASDGIAVLESSVRHVFGQQVTFTLRAVSDAKITKVHLLFKPAGEQRTTTVPLTVEPSLEISVQHIHDLRLAPLPPFATVTFQWQIEDSSGSQLTSEPRSFQYVDSRFDWEHLSADGIAVNWIKGQGDLQFGQTALDIARSSLEAIAAELRLSAHDPTNIQIYDSQINLEGAMLLAGQEWTAHQAYPELGTVIIAVPSGEETDHASQMQRLIPHEITHLLVYQTFTRASYGYLPEWLDEGLAVANERLPTPEYSLLLEEAHEQGRLLSLENLCLPFSPSSPTTQLAYAQSGSIVRFIREQYGAPGIRALLASYRNGESCAGGIQRALGTSIGELESRWQNRLEAQLPQAGRVDQISIWMGLWLLSVLTALPMIGGPRRRR